MTWSAIASVAAVLTVVLEWVGFLPGRARERGDATPPSPAPAQEMRREPQAVTGRWARSVRAVLAWAFVAVATLVGAVVLAGWQLAWLTQ